MCFFERIKFRLTFAAFLLFAHNFAIAVEILSKEDAKRTFSTSFDEWKSAAGILQSQNSAKTLIASKYEITFVVDQGHSILKVTPSYQEGNLSRPHKINVSVEQRQDFSALTRSMKDGEIKKMIADWYQRMLPEFTLMTSVDMTSGLVQYDFTIFEVGRIPLLDLVGQQTNGCWQQCIRR